MFIVKPANNTLKTSLRSRALGRSYDSRQRCINNAVNLLQSHCKRSDRGRWFIEVVTADILRPLSPVLRPWISSYEASFVLVLATVIAFAILCGLRAGRANAGSCATAIFVLFWIGFKQLKQYYSGCGSSFRQRGCNYIGWLLIPTFPLG